MGPFHNKIPPGEYYSNLPVVNRFFFLFNQQCKSPRRITTHDYVTFTSYLVSSVSKKLIKSNSLIIMFVIACPEKWISCQIALSGTNA